MRSVVLSIAVHAVLGVVLVLRVTTHSQAAEVAAEEPRPVEVELYVELPNVEPPIVERAHQVGAMHMPTSHAPAGASSSPRGDAIATMSPTGATEVSPSPPLVPTLPSPHDAAEAVSLPAARAVDSAAPTTTSVKTFRMRVGADGTAHLTDRRNFQWGRGGSIGHVEEDQAEGWLDEHHEQSNAVDMKLPKLLATVASFDVTDAAMRLAGQDPYAYEKLKALDATRDERAQIGARHHERQLLDTPALVRASLADIARLPADQRAAAISALYLECDDSPAGEVARATIADYVRARGLAIDLRSR
ncbi:MAG: hypothetical protein ABI704_16555 [Kofleriaceae bacterium]